MRYLVDTNILGELTRTKPNPNVLEWARHATDITLSAIVVDEVYFGLSWRPNARIQDWFETFLERHCRVVPVTEEIARRAGELRGDLRSRGKVRTQADMLLAATAAAHDLLLVTRNTRDFDDCGIRLQNPFLRPK